MSKIAKQGAILESEVDSRPRGKRTPPRLAASAGSSSTRFLLSTPPKRCIDSSPPSPENTPPNFGAWNPIQSTDLASPRGAGKRGEYFLDGYVQKNDAKIANEFMEVVREIYRETEEDEDCIHNYYFHGSCSAAFSPRTFVERFTSEAPLFGDGGQHDCHEFIRALVDQLSDDLKDMTRCREFKRRLESENMSDEMSIRDQAESSWEKHLATNSSLVTDIFGGQLISTIRCEACGHEKRFGNEQQKIGTSVEYPCSDLDVSALAYGDNTDAPRYDLYAVSDHHGSVNFGHYTSSCKLVTEEAFYSFNDEEVDEMVDLDGSKVYILFYKLRNK
ncbi:hypothetical protein THAOC_10607 [Thalassiosira oceanica]|uniref:USP domain-containing protein n=1 Tax=Thalassiosira oceanica TaxID=159749 RepID=K0SS89_THAOC|nr:hypothetical protein THAOC_10607 [Thalassiosira oceanica]|eukprot:EJK68235.1 hypothetical protein THAOC_10607 [Thalassiosira oceanica]